MPTKNIFTTIIITLFMALAWIPPASAGSIKFQFERRNDHCVIVNHGDSSAYYPVVYQLGRNGQWLTLQTGTQQAEIPPGRAVTARLIAPAATATKSDLDFFQVVLIRFFDQAGVSFGQMSPLRPPFESVYALRGHYAGRRLILEPPPKKSTIGATWVVAPKEEGIAPIFTAQSFNQPQPPAPRIDWHQQQSATIDIGAAQPAALLFHETIGGLTLQRIQMKDTKISQQRTAWLTMRRPFYITAALCGLCGLLLFACAYRVKS
jgi:hypothetical protein